MTLVLTRDLQLFLLEQGEENAAEYASTEGDICT